MKQKVWYKSKINLANIIVVLIGVAELLLKTGWISLEYLIFGIGILNVILRTWFTEHKIIK